MENTVSKVSIQDLNLYYGDFHALKGINMEIPTNQVTAFIGPSGCGKSTCLKTLNRMNDLVENCRITGKVTIDGEDIYEYSAWGREILRYCVHKGERYDGEPMWNPDNKLIKFIPETEWSDPSYHLPHFYEVFAEEADEEDRPFWHEAAAASRRYLQAACDERTGMNAEYADYDGKPHVDESNHWHFYSDAYRTAANIGLDAAWNGPQEVLCDRVAALQRFFLTHDRTSVYAIDGTAVDEVVLHPVGFLAATAQGALAAVHSAQPDAEHNAREWVRMLWNTPMRTGTRRYYDNFLYAFAMLALSGKYRYE